MVLLDQLNSILSAAQVPQSLQIPWREAFKHLEPKEVELMFKILSRAVPQEISYYSSLLQRKIDAFMNRDAELWRKIIGEERQRLAKP